jgi:adenosine/AMP kinase
VVIGQAHFIKTAEDLGEILSAALPQAQWGLAFNEASGPCLVRSESNADELRRAAVEMALAIGAGHVFVLLLRGGYPIQVLDRIKACPEVCTIVCATANAVSVLVVDDGTRRGVIGVLDGEPPKGVEQAEDVASRREFLRRIGYKY